MNTESRSNKNPLEKEDEYRKKQPILPWGRLAVIGIIGGILLIVWKFGM